MIQKLTFLREKHRNKSHRHHLYPLTYVEIINWFSLFWWGYIFHTDKTLMQRALSGSIISFIGIQDFWQYVSFGLCFLLALGYLAPVIRYQIGTFVFNGRSLGLVLSASYWFLFSTLLWIIGVSNIMNMTYSVLAFSILVVSTRVLAYER